MYIIKNTYTHTKPEQPKTLTLAVCYPRESVETLVLLELVDLRDQWDPVDPLEPLDLMVAR